MQRCSSRNATRSLSAQSTIATTTARTAGAALSN